MNISFFAPVLCTIVKSIHSFTHSLRRRRSIKWARKISLMVMAAVWGEHRPQATRLDSCAPSCCHIVQQLTVQSAPRCVLNPTPYCWWCWCVFVVAPEKVTFAMNNPNWGGSSFTKWRVIYRKLRLMHSILRNLIYFSDNSPLSRQIEHIQSWFHWLFLLWNFSILFLGSSLRIYTRKRINWCCRTLDAIW